MDNQATVVAEFERSGRDLSELPRIPSNAFYAGSEFDLAGAIVAADEVVLGTVEGQRLVLVENLPAARHIVSTVAITRLLKGDEDAATIELEQFGAPVMQDDGTYALVINENDPVVRTGDQIVLFARRATTLGRFMAISYKTLTVKSGRVAINPRDGQGRRRARTEKSRLAAG